jgi:hypothetical protein
MVRGSDVYLFLFLGLGYSNGIDKSESSDSSPDIVSRRAVTVLSMWGKDGVEPFKVSIQHFLTPNLGYILIFLSRKDFVAPVARISGSCVVFTVW